jgi:hypothetical protein
VPSSLWTSLAPASIAVSAISSGSAPVASSSISPTAEGAAAARQHRPHLADGPVPVVGHRLDHQGGAARAVPLVPDLVVVVGAALAGRLGDGPLDVLLRHARRARPVDRQPQPEVVLGVGQAGAGSDGDLARQLGEQLAALGVGRALLALDRRPFGVTGHG